MWVTIETEDLVLIQRIHCDGDPNAPWKTLRVAADMLEESADDYTDEPPRTDRKPMTMDEFVRSIIDEDTAHD